MKKLIIFGIILSSFVMAQFSSGTISAGSVFSYMSYKMDADSDAESFTTFGSDASLSTVFTSIAVNQSFSYFIMGNISVDAILSFNTISEGDDSYKINMYGVGGSYYMNNLYGGGGFAIASSGEDKMSTANYLIFRGGYLHKLTENVFLDIGASYSMGIGKYKYDGEEYGDNEKTILRVGAGVKAFFNI